MFWNEVENDCFVQKEKEVENLMVKRSGSIKY